MKFPLAALLTALVPLAHADDQSDPRVPDSEPLSVNNLSPLAGLVALPAMRSAGVTRGWKLTANTAIASHWAVDARGNEEAFFDGETTRFTVAADYGFAPDWSVGVALPWLSHDGGFLDGLINDWHSVFGLSDGNRADFPEDQLRYSYTSPRHQIAFQDAEGGIGDVSLDVSHAFYRRPGQVAAISLGYKFATGDEDRFTGSGAEDGFVQLRYSGEHLGDLPLTWHGQVGYVAAGSSELLGPDQRRHLWQLGLALDWQLSPAWSVLAQYDGHSGVLHSDLDAAGAGGAAMLSLAARWRATRHWSLDFGFTEDIRVETAPDVTFFATLRWRPEADG